VWSYGARQAAFLVCRALGCRGWGGYVACPALQIVDQVWGGFFSLMLVACCCFFLYFLCSNRLPGGGITFFAAAKKVIKESSFLQPDTAF
jgi:hypothetical protein